MSFMSMYFKKKANNGVWSNSYHQNKRKRDDVDVAVKKLKLVLVEPERNKPNDGDDDEDDEEDVKIEDQLVVKSSKVFPSFHLKNVTFMSKSLRACLCQCSEDGISIFLDDFFTEDSSITFKFMDLESAEFEMKSLKVSLEVKKTRIENLKKVFQLESWNHNNCTDGLGSNIVMLNASEMEAKEAIEQFHQHLINNLKDSSDATEEPQKLDEGFCEEVSGTTEIDVRSFYGSSGKTQTSEREIEDERKPKCETSKKRSKKECENCGEEMKTPKFNRKPKCLSCESEKRKKKSERSDVEDISLSPTVEPRRLFEYPLPPSVGRITFTNHDRSCLEPGEFFNDVNIDFYLKFFHQEVLSPEDRNRTHIFSSFFYSHLTSDPVKVTPMNKAKSRHQRVRNWTRNVDIFSKDFIIVPINQKCHWFLAIICFPGLCGKPKEVERCCLEDDEDDDDGPPGKNKVQSKEKVSCNQSGLDWIAGYESGSDENLPKTNKNVKVSSEVVKSPLILIFDSLSTGSPKWDVSTTLRQYLQIEWNEKKNSTRGEDYFSSRNLKGCYPSCPQQSNHYDCGPYLLLFVQHFFVSPITNFIPPIKKLKNWFSKGEADAFRKDLQKLVDRLDDEYSKDVDRNESVDASNGEIVIS